MHRYNWRKPAVIFLLFLSCNKPLPEINGIDLQSWKNDRNGCAGKRSAMTSAIKSEKNKLLSLDEIQVTHLLGRPDRNELSKRNQKIYFYFLEPSAACAGQVNEKPLKLVIRFNAMGLAKELTVEE